MTKREIRLISMSMSLFMVLIAVVSSGTCCYAGSKYRLPSKIKYYNSVHVLDSRYTFKYNKHKDPKKIVIYNLEDDDNKKYKTYNLTYKYKYKKGKRSSMKDSNDTKYTYNKKGYLTKVVPKDGKMTITPKKGYWVKKCGSTKDDYQEYKYTYKNKKLKRIDTYSHYDGKKSLAAKTYFNKKGNITKYLDYSVDAEPVKFTYKYKYNKKGLITSIKSYCGSDFAGEIKISYSKKTTNKARYMDMINFTMNQNYITYANQWF